MLRLVLARRLRRSTSYGGDLSKARATLSRASNIESMRGEYLSLFFQDTLSVIKGWGSARHVYTIFSHTDQGGFIIASFILQHYGLILWLSASIQCAVAAFASINCSYPDSVVGQSRRRVCLGIDQRDSLLGGARQTLICGLY